MSYIGSKPANKPVVASDIDPTVITGQTALAVAPADTDEFLISDAGVLKRLDASLIGGGKVLQVVNMTSTDDTSTTSTSFVATALTDTITPSATSSKILIIATGNVNNTAAYQWTYVTITKGGTNLGAAAGMTGVYSDGGDIHAPCTTTYLDAPNSTSELTYDVRIRVTGGTGKWNQHSAKISLTLMEIAG